MPSLLAPKAEVSCIHEVSQIDFYLYLRLCLCVSLSLPLCLSLPLSLSLSLSISIPISVLSLSLPLSLCLSIPISPTLFPHSLILTRSNLGYFLSMLGNIREGKDFIFSGYGSVRNKSPVFILHRSRGEGGA